MKKIRLILILLAALCMFGCTDQTEIPETIEETNTEKSEEEKKEEQTETEEKKDEDQSEAEEDKQTEEKEDLEAETPAEQTAIAPAMLKIENNILTFTDDFTFEGISAASKIAVVIENESNTWKYSTQTTYTSDFSLNIDNEIFTTVVTSTKSMPVEEKVTVTILEAKKEWTYICHTDFNYKPDTERIAVFDYNNKTFTPKTMTFTEESAWTASEKMKNGTNISNDLDCVVEDLKGYDLPPVIWETSWSATPVTLENIRYLKSLGFNAIRLPVSWAQHLDSNNNVYTSWMNRVQEVVDWCMDEDMYVIINTHHDGGPKQENKAEGSSWIRATEESYNSNKDLYVKILSQICDRFKNYSEKLIFANVNEVCAGDSIPSLSSQLSDANFQVMEKWNQLFVDTVRSSGGNNAKRNISVSSIATSYDEDFLSRIELPEDSVENHLLFEVHCYDPWDFCGEGTECTITKFSESGFDVNHALLPAFEFSLKNNIPVWIGEWGVFDNTETGKIIEDEERAKYAEQFISYATKHDLTPFIWNPCYYIGYTSQKDAGHYCPKFIKAIQDNIYESEYTSFSLSRDYKWDAETNAPSTTEYDFYGIKLDLTDTFEQLPAAGDTVSVTYKFISDKDLSDLYFYFVDTSSATNSYWLKLDGDYETYGLLQNITSGTEFTLSYNQTLVTSPEGNITFWLYYPKTVLDEETKFIVKKN